MRSVLSLVLLLVVVLSTRCVFAQTPEATGQNYWGIDLGATYSWYAGQNNFLLPMRELIEGSGFFSIGSYETFDGLGSGPGLVVGSKLAFAVSPSLDLEAKIRYVMNYSFTTEDHFVRVMVGNTMKSEPVTNSYSLLLHNMDFDLLAHVGLSNVWYGAGGISYSTLLDNHITGSQTQRGGDDWTYMEEGTQTPSSFRSITVDGRLDNFFSPSRFGLLVGGGTTFSIDEGPTVLDAGLLLSIPLTRWLQDSGESAVNSWSSIAGATPVTFPKSWYATLTIGVRFPFGGAKKSEPPPSLATTLESKPPKQESVRNNTVFLKGTVIDSNGQPISDASITAVNLSTGRAVTIDTTDRIGRYSIRVITPGTYSVTAEKNGYLFGTAFFEVDESGHIRSKHPDIKLSTVVNGRTPLLLFFDFNSSELKSSSYPELDRAVRLLQDSPTMQVEIAGYTDSVGSQEVNKALSERRAGAVRDYIVKNGIANHRVNAKGYGEEFPIADNGTDEGRAENRRVEFVVLSK